MIKRTLPKTGTTVLGEPDTNVLVSDDFYSLPTGAAPRLQTLYCGTIMVLLASVWPDAKQPRWELFTNADPQLVEIRCIVALSDQPQPRWLYLHSGHAKTAVGLTRDFGATLDHDLKMDCLDILNNDCVDDFIGWFSAHAHDPTGCSISP